MQEYRPELTDEELEQQRKAFEALAEDREGKFQSILSAERAVFSSDKKLSKSEKKELKRMRPKSKIVAQEMGSVKSVGGVDYQATPEGWKKIGLTQV